MVNLLRDEPGLDGLDASLDLVGDGLVSFVAIGLELGRELLQALRQLGPLGFEPPHPPRRYFVADPIGGPGGQDDLIDRAEPCVDEGDDRTERGDCVPGCDRPVEQDDAGEQCGERHGMDRRQPALRPPVHLHEGVVNEGRDGLDC